MSRPYEGKGKLCEHPGCKVWISLTLQPRRFALGLCRTHEAKPEAVQARWRVSDRPGVRVVDVVRAAYSGSGSEGGVMRVSVSKEPWL